jgi:hypothetical protein
MSQSPNRWGCHCWSKIRSATAGWSSSVVFLQLRRMRFAAERATHRLGERPNGWVVEVDQTILLNQNVMQYVIVAITIGDLPLRRSPCAVG